MGIRIKRLYRRMNKLGDMLLVIIPESKKDIDEFALYDGKDLTGYELEIKRPRRSKSANAYMWVLCDRLARRIKVTREDVYRKAIREVGDWIPAVVINDDVERIKESWARNGKGWFAETVQEYTYKTEMFLYIGSSVYDTKRMSELIDYLVNECIWQNIPTESPEEIEYYKSLQGG